MLTSGFTKKREEYANGENKRIAKLVANMLSKPYNRTELAMSVRRTLDEEG